MLANRNNSPQTIVSGLIVGVTTNIAKSPMFSDNERIAIVRREVAAVGGNIQVVGFNSLLVDFAEAQGAATVIREIGRASCRERVLASV